MGKIFKIKNIIIVLIPVCLFVNRDDDVTLNVIAIKGDMSNVSYAYVEDFSYNRIDLMVRHNARVNGNYLYISGMSDSIMYYKVILIYKNGSCRSIQIFSPINKIEIINLEDFAL